MLTIDYDLLDRPTRVTYPDGSYEETVYNRLDPEAERDRLGRWTHTFYDALRRVVSRRDPAGGTLSQSWCTCGSLDQLIDARGAKTAWERDAQGRVTQTVRADGTAKSYTYEATTSRLKSITDAKGQTKTYAYTRDGKLTQVTYSNTTIPTATVTFTYETVYGRLATVTDGTGTSAYTYHPVGALGAGRTRDVDGPLPNDLIGYEYDELGRMVTRSLNGTTVTRTYDSLNRIASQVTPMGTFTYAYDGATRRLLTLSYPNGQEAAYSYLGNGGDRALQSIHNWAPSTSTTLSRFDYEYDAVGNITRWTRQVGADPPQRYELGYAQTNALTTATLTTTDATPAVMKRYGYGYDAAGNRTSMQVDNIATTATYDQMNALAALEPGGAIRVAGTLSEPGTVVIQNESAAVAADGTFAAQVEPDPGSDHVGLVATDPSGNSRSNVYHVGITGPSSTFTYDLNGNLLGDGARTFEWDGENRLVRVCSGPCSPATELARFVYDARGRRREAATEGVTRTFIYAGLHVAEERSSTGGVVRYFFGRGIDDIVAQLDSAGVARYYAKDHLGSVREVTDEERSLVLRRDYDPWGTPIDGAGEAGFAFTGREWDPVIGLYYYRARYYEGTLGRFISRDPIGGRAGPNEFVYGYNNPVRYSDPFGLCPPKCFEYKLTYCNGCHCFTIFAPSTACRDREETRHTPKIVVYWSYCNDDRDYGPHSTAEPDVDDENQPDQETDTEENLDELWDFEQYQFNPFLVWLRQYLNQKRLVK